MLSKNHEAQLLNFLKHVYNYLNSYKNFYSPRSGYPPFKLCNCYMPSFWACFHFYILTCIMVSPEKLISISSFLKMDPHIYNIKLFWGLNWTLRTTYSGQCLSYNRIEWIVDFILCPPITFQYIMLSYFLLRICERHSFCNLKISFFIKIKTLWFCTDV